MNVAVFRPDDERLADAVALIEKGTRPGQQVATGTLDTIVNARDEVGIEPPAVTVVGGVAGLWAEESESRGEGA